jgi:DNA replication protein DnaC
MKKSLEEQLQQSNIEELCFDERLALMLEREITERENRRLKTRLKQAKLKQVACMESIDFKATRGLSQSVMLALSACKWIKEHHNILITGPTGTGKTFLACALSHKACLEGYSAYYTRVPRLLHDILVSKSDGRYAKLMAQLAKYDVLILDDWGLSKLTDAHRRDLLELLDDRHNTKSTIVTSQFPVKDWYDMIGDPTLADAILDRIIHNAHKIHLKGESFRKQKSKEIEKVDLGSEDDK